MASKLLCTLLLILAIWINQADSRKINKGKLSMSERYDQWIKQFGRKYTEGERERRFNIFKDNVKFIDDFNADEKKTYKLSVNKFADLTNEEFKGLRSTGYKKSKKISHLVESKPFVYRNTTNIPASVDWRKEGAVTGVKDQGECGGCWAFSAVAATEGITKIKKGKLISLSEQELIDCDRSDLGCEGGEMRQAFNFIKNNKGLTTETNYPYNGRDGHCNRDKNDNPTSVAKIVGYGVVPKNNETALLNAVAKQPVSVAIEASGMLFQFYSSGIITGGCGNKVDHGVTAVGYGVSDDGTKYWIVKNSWGENWGENGYVRIQRDVKSKGGLCGIATDCSFPLV